MKKLLTLVVTAIMAVTAAIGLVGCNKQELNFGKELLVCEAQLDTLTQLDTGSIDVSIIDSVMAGFYTVEGDFKDKITMLDYTFAEEFYGIAGRKEDKAFVSKINDALIAMASKEYSDVAKTYGLISSTTINPATENPLAGATDESWNEIKNAGKIVIGYTIFSPIAYDVVDGQPTKGFDIDLAKKVVAYLNEQESLNLTVEFLEIDWNTKEAQLENGSIDLVWNGLTITEQRSAEMCISIPYLKNFQVAVVLKEDAAQYNDLNKNNLVEKFADKIIGVEGGSAGESVVVKSAE